MSWYLMIANSNRDLKLHHYVRRNSHDFASFIENCTAIINDYDGRKSFTRNQIDYMSNWRGRPIVDFVGRYETFERDAQWLFARIGLSEIELPHERRTSHAHYSAYYTDELAAIVERRFARDIKAFGYRFERRSSPSSS